MQVGPHPHIGLQTFTWMIRGEVLHRDSLGNTQIIRPGQVNLMTAGHGIAHSEESQTPSHIHAAQLWIALPESHRHCAPRFEHYDSLPRTVVGDFQATVLAGEALGLRSPAQVHSPLMAVDLVAASDGAPTPSAHMDLRPDFEHAVLGLSGEITANGQTLAAEQLLYLPAGVPALELACTPGSQLLLIGGEPMQEAIVLWWNFVARTGEEMVQARAQWQAEMQAPHDALPQGQPRRFGPALLESPLAPLHAPSLQGVQLQASR